MKLTLPLIAISLCASLYAALPRTACAESSQQTGTVTGAVAAPAKAAGVNPASAHAALAARAAARVQARATEEKIAANARSARLAQQQRAALLQRHRQAQQNAAQTLSRAQSQLGQVSARSAGVTMAGATTARITTAGSIRTAAAGQNLSAWGHRGATGASQPGLRVTQTGAPVAIAPSSRVTVASGSLGGPQRQLAGRVGGPALGASAGSVAIDGRQMRRRL